jgi:hypothetical protein
MTARKLASASALTLLALLAATSAAQPQGEAPRPPRQAQPGDQPQGDRGGRGSGEITSVESAMKTINRSFRRLRQQIADADKKEDNLKLVATIEKAIVAAKSMPVPEKRPQRGREGDAGPRGAAPHGYEQPESKPQAEQPKPSEPMTPERAKATEEYRRDLLKLLRQVTDIEQDLLDNKFDQAKTELAKLPQMRDDAHKALGVKKDDDDRD